MKSLSRCTLLCLLIGWTMNAQADVLDFNFGWQFYQQQRANERLTDVPEDQWESVRLPHDWSVAEPFSKEHGDGATGYLPGGIGWYRKTFSTEPVTDGEQTFLCFDGVYNNAEFWLNGSKLGEHPYGYAPFYYDITPILHTDDKPNVLTVRVDRTRSVDSRWYTGSGIYRNVTLVRKNALHIPIWGTYLTTPDVSNEAATVNLQVTIKNANPESTPVTITTKIYAPDGGLVGEVKSESSLDAGAEKAATQSVVVSKPKRWDTENPNLYRAVTTLAREDQVTESYTTPFGIRTLRFDPNEGFFLNETPTTIKGVCLHHAAGLVGAAVPLGVWERRLETLKAAGCNAIRTAHNPMSAEFMDLCDRMGFLVQDEFFDEWEYPKDKRHNLKERQAEYLTEAYAKHFGQWAERDLKATMLRDRNHPSIFMWSIGNEIEWTFPRYRAASGYFDGEPIEYFWSPPRITHKEIRARFEASPEEEFVLAKTAKRLADWTREMDTTRPVTANLILPSVSHETGYTDALDIIGYSYRRPIYDYAHKLYPEKMLYGGENVVQWHEWQHVAERPFTPGLFLWTGIDYMGETHDKWPTKALASGMLDIAGFKKASYHMMKSLWNPEPHVHITTQTVEDSVYQIDEQTQQLVEKKPDGWQRRLWIWHDVNRHWNYAEDQMTAVEVYSNCDEVELLLNDRSLGKKRLADFPDHIYKWAVPFRPGKLHAVGTQDKPVTSAATASSAIHTASAPTTIRLTVDKTALTADGYDVAHVIVQLLDQNNHPVLTDEREIVFDIDGDCRLLGVDNGAPDSTQDYQTNQVVTSEGRCLMIIQSTNPGTINISAASSGIKSNALVLQAQ